MNNLILRDVVLPKRKRNFEGRPSDYNDAGKRNFEVLIPVDLVDDLRRDGWPVKDYMNREGITVYYMKIHVVYGEKFNPLAVLIDSRGKRRLNEDNVGQLDWTPMAKCDLVIFPLAYGPKGNRPGGISPRLNSIYVTVQEDELAPDYADIPDLDMVEGD